jgi:hypothetical protein
VPAAPPPATRRQSLEPPQTLPQRTAARAPRTPPFDETPAQSFADALDIPAWSATVDVHDAAALRRARTAIDMLREGAGRTGVRVEVALGLLRTVRNSPTVREAVESAYADAAARRAHREWIPLALAMHEVGAAEAAEALLLAYARADRVLAARIRRALAECDPADVRAHRDLIDALPIGRRQNLLARV